MQATVRLYGRLAGHLWREPDGTIGFQYDSNYVEKALPALSASLPLRKAPWIGHTLPPYFSGLVSEGWLRETQAREQGINKADSFALLVHNGADLAGAVTIELHDARFEKPLDGRDSRAGHNSADT